MKAIQRLGLVLWRGGIIFVAAYIAYYALRAVLTITDPQLEFAVGVLFTGVLFVIASLIGERIQDARAERSDGP